MTLCGRSLRGWERRSLALSLPQASDTEASEGPEAHTPAPEPFSALLARVLPLEPMESMSLGSEREAKGLGYVVLLSQSSWHGAGTLTKPAVPPYPPQDSSSHSSNSPSSLGVLSPGGRFAHLWVPSLWCGSSPHPPEPASSSVG